MKKSTLERQLKAESELFVPDPYEKIMAAAKAEAPSEPQTERPDRRDKKARTKRRNIGIAASFAAAAVCLAVVLPVTLNGGGDASPLSVRLTPENSYGIGAVTTVKLLSESLSAERSVSAFSVPYAATSASVKTQAETFNRYFTAFDSFLGDGVVSTSTSENTDGNYPYAIRMTISGIDFNGNAVAYTMYYTETTVDEKSDGRKTENEYLLEGVMQMDGTDYYLEGKRSDESKKDETESELEIRAYADKNDRKTYIEMSQEISAEEKKDKTEYETEYVYSVFENGKLVEETAIEFKTEQKDGKEETSFELEFRNGDAKGKYEVKREVRDGASEMKVKYKIDGEEGEFRIRESADGNNGKYEYLFSDNESLVL